MKTQTKQLIFLILVLSTSEIFAKNRGIVNQNGNDCFMNASTQALSHIPELREFYSKIKNLKEFKQAAPLQTFFQYISRLGPLPEARYKEPNALQESKKFREYWTNSKNYPEANIINLKNMAGGQHDAQEFLSAILDILDFYFDKLINDSKNMKLKNPINSIKFKLKSSTKSLECEHFSSKEDDTSLLSLSIAGLTLSDCLNKFSEEEKLKDTTDLTKINPSTHEPYDRDDRWECENCSKNKGAKIKVDAAKYIKISTLPKYLIIQFKRFLFGDLAQKLTTNIKFPENLILNKDSSILDEDITEKLGNGTITYTLFAFICHGGGTGGGHYWAYAKDTSKKWYCYNDENVSIVGQAKLTSILNQTSEQGTPYILFYELDNNSQKTLADMAKIKAKPKPKPIPPQPKPQPSPLQQKLAQLKISLQELGKKLITLQDKLKILHSKI